MELKLHRVIEKLLSTRGQDAEQRTNQIYSLPQRIDQLMNTSHQSETHLLGTCHVCGKPVSELITLLPAPPGGSKFTCSQCGKQVCASCYSQSRKKCVRCTANRDSWCKTPQI